MGSKWSANTKRNYCPTIKLGLDREVDFDAMRELINVMTRMAKKNGGKLKYTIVSDNFIKPLGKTESRVTSKAWIEHDDHIHLEFFFP